MVLLGMELDFLLLQVQVFESRMSVMVRVKKTNREGGVTVMPQGT